MSDHSRKPTRSTSNERNETRASRPGSNAAARNAALKTSAPRLRKGGSARTAAASASELRRLQDAGFSRDELFRLVAPRRTLERRLEKNQPLSVIETDRVQRLSRVLGHAVRVFGSDEKAHRWLRKPSRTLDGAVPLELLSTETGAHLVTQELHAIDHGQFA